MAECSSEDPHWFAWGLFRVLLSISVLLAAMCCDPTMTKRRSDNMKALLRICLSALPSTGAFCLIRYKNFSFLDCVASLISAFLLICFAKIRFGRMIATREGFNVEAVTIFQDFTIPLVDIGLIGFTQIFLIYIYVLDIAANVPCLDDRETHWCYWLGTVTSLAYVTRNDVIGSTKKRFQFWSDVSGSENGDTWKAIDGADEAMDGADEAMDGADETIITYKWELTARLVLSCLVEYGGLASMLLGIPIQVASARSPSLFVLSLVVGSFFIIEFGCLTKLHKFKNTTPVDRVVDSGVELLPLLAAPDAEEQ